jgi:hypothetical protein
VLAGKFISKRGQQEAKCLPLLEKALIRYFLSEGHDLVNKQGTRLRRHEITSKKPQWIVPKLMFLDHLLSNQRAMIPQNHLRGVVTGRASDAAARMGAGTAVIKPLQRAAVIGMAEHRSRREQLVQR